MTRYGCLPQICWKEYMLQMFRPPLAEYVILFYVELNQPAKILHLFQRFFIFYIDSQRDSSECRS